MSGLKNKTSLKKILSIYSAKDNPEEDIVDPKLREVIKKKES